jgi:4a-hydroxytetrahydrobiopterin dehydratase
MSFSSDGMIIIISNQTAISAAGLNYHVFAVTTMRLHYFYLSVSLNRRQTFAPPAKVSLLAMTSTSSSASAPKCVPCSDLDDSARLSLEEAEAAISRLGQLWVIKESDGVLSLVRNFTARDFQSALDSINAMGIIAERESHHPNFHLTNYRQVEIEIYTHKLKGLTKNDFTLADQLNNEVKVNYSPKWLKENPTASSTSLI